MAPKQAEDLSVDETNFKNTLQTYLDHRHQLHAQAEWVKNKFGLRMKEMFLTKKAIRVLGVGSGLGETDIEFLNEIVSWGRKIHGDSYRVTYEVVEPNETCANHFRNIVTNDRNYRNVTFHWFIGNFEPFCGQSTKKYDLVHFVRCLYHIGSVKAFNAAYNLLLAENGIVVGMGESNGFWPKIMPLFFENGLTHEAFSMGFSSYEDYYLSGWSAQALKNNWKYESYAHTYDYDVTPMFDADSREGNMLIDFTFHIKNSRMHMPREVMNQFFRFLNKNVQVKETIENGRRVTRKCFPCEFGAIMITKHTTRSGVKYS